jgi:hypothetical protein
VFEVAVASIRHFADGHDPDGATEQALEGLGVKRWVTTGSEHGGGVIGFIASG